MVTRNAITEVPQTIYKSAATDNEHEVSRDKCVLEKKYEADVKFLSDDNKPRNDDFFVEK